jgi:hypothetical protein
MYVIELPIQDVYTHGQQSRSFAIGIGPIPFVMIPEVSPPYVCIPEFIP